MRLLVLSILMFGLNHLSAQVKEGTKYLRSQSLDIGFKFSVWEEKIIDTEIKADTFVFSVQQNLYLMDSFMVINGRYYQISYKDTFFLFDESFSKGDTFFLQPFYDNGDSVRHIVSDKKKIGLENGDSAWLWSMNGLFGALRSWLQYHGSVDFGFRYKTFSGLEYDGSVLLICQNGNLLYRQPHMEPRCDSLYWWQRVNVSNIENRQSKIYPNPVTAFLNIDNLNNPMALFSIISSTGKTVLSGKLDENKIDVGLLPKGIYILKIKTKEEESHLHFLKE